MEKCEQEMCRLLFANRVARGQLKANIKLLVVYKNQMKISWESGVETGNLGLNFVKIVAVCQNIVNLETIHMKRKLETEEMLKALKIHTLPDASDMISSIVNVLKSNMRVLEEVSPEVRHILEKVDKPDSLLELCLSRVRGLADLQKGDFLQGSFLVGLPVTLQTQIEHWSATRDLRIQETVDFLAEARAAENLKLAGN